MHISLGVMAIMRLLNHSPGTSGKPRFEIIFEDHVARGRARCFILQNTTYNPYSPENIAFASSDIVVTLAHHWVDYNVLSVVFGALPLTFWLAIKGFEADFLNTCESLENGTNGISALEKYNELKALTCSMNSVWTTLVLSTIMELFMTIIFLHNSVTSGNIIWFVQFCLKILFLMVGVLIMAEGCRFVS